MFFPSLLWIWWSSWSLVVDDDYPGVGGWGSVAAYFTWESSSCLCPQTSPIKSRPKFYPVKGEFSDENSDEGGFHKLGNPTFSHPELVGALWPLFTDTSRRGMSAIYFTKFAPIEFLFPATPSEEFGFKEELFFFCSNMCYQFKNLTEFLSQAPPSEEFLVSRRK